MVLLRAVRILLLGSVMSGAAEAPALAWGHLGHRAIAVVAEKRLDAEALKNIRAIAGGVPLADLSTWPDDLKASVRHRGRLNGDDDAGRFVSRFPDHAEWHFVNLPLGSKAYSLTGPFARSNDIVHEIRACIAVLESPGSREGLTKLEALRFLVHLTGDVHQPLHVASGYYRASSSGRIELVRDPERAGRVHDHGGNQLMIVGHPGKSLHAHWDADVVEAVARTTQTSRLAAQIAARLDDPEWRKHHRAELETKGDHRSFAERWATDSIHAAALIYDDFEFESEGVEARGSLEKRPVVLGNPQTDLAALQLALAAEHLAALLNHIEWR